MATRESKVTTCRQGGFSLLEMVFSLAILSIVMGVVVQGVNTTQARNVAETNKLDLTQESREFMDQITNDLRQSGFPRPGMFDPTGLVPAASPAAPPNCINYANLACGLMYVDQTQVIFEGDVDGTGVSEEWIQLKQTNGPAAANCTAPPCVIQRGTVSKATFMATGTLPPFYTEVNNVMNTNIFTAYDNNATDLSAGFPIVNASVAGLNLRAIGITLVVRSSQADPQTGAFPTVTMVSTARVND